MSNAIYLVSFVGWVVAAGMAWWASWERFKRLAAEERIAKAEAAAVSAQKGQRALHGGMLGGGL